MSRETQSGALCCRGRSSLQRGAFHFFEANLERKRENISYTVTSPVSDACVLGDSQLVPEVEEDLWHTYNLIANGDHLSSTTFRYTTGRPVLCHWQATSHPTSESSTTPKRTQLSPPLSGVPLVHNGKSVRAVPL